MAPEQPDWDWAKVRIEKSLKENLTATLNDMGLTIPVFLRLAVLYVVEERKVPFIIRAPKEPAKETV